MIIAPIGTSVTRVKNDHVALGPPQYLGQRFALIKPTKTVDYGVELIMQKHYSGFTLVELMIVVAIIGILAAVAIPLYQGNVMKSQINRAVGELGAYKSAFEMQIANGGMVTNSDLGYVSSDLTDGTMATDIGVANPDGSGHLEVTMGDSAHSSLTGIILRFERDPAGTWTCEINKSAASGWRPDYRPQGCTVL
jgi:type IV pilus assembly protein PilA